MARADGDDLLTPWLMERFAAGDTLLQSLRQTILPSRPATPAPAAPAAAATPALLSADTPRIRLKHTLGQGGMGVVRLAEQVALGRDVAVKTLRPETKASDGARELLREAWISGSIEHPNVVPVHDVGTEADGSPYIILKRVEGVTWQALIHDAKAVREQHGDSDVLAWNLGILLQLLNALRYAHSRGIIHRDLKPENVMIGEFGEVYLLDWGIALSLRDDGSGRLPLASEVTSVAGTPGYMAPEMIRAHAPLNERTDIYLVGALLYEILAGHAPHSGANAHEIVACIRRSEPPAPAGAPPALMRIVRRAMDPDPAGRFESAEQVRLAIQGYLQHRGAAHLAARASARLDELLALLATPSHTPDARQRCYDLFGACRFGFHESLAAWPTNELARDGLARAIEVMVEYELGQGNALVAASLLDELTPPPERLRERVAAARAEEERKRAHLEKLGRDLDIGIGRHLRVAMSLIIGVTLMAIPLAAFIPGSDRAFATHARMTVWTTAFLVFILVLGWFTRQRLTQSGVNQRLFGTVVLMLVAQNILQLGLWMADMTPLQVVYSDTFLWFFTTAMLALLVDRRLTVTAIAYLAAFLVTTIEPSLRFHAMAAATAVLMINAALIWWPRADPGEGQS